jgi:hypothetical protein
MALKVCLLEAVRRRTFICCRNARISASSAAHDRNRSTAVQTMSLTRSIIPQQHHPILSTAQPDWVCDRDTSQSHFPAARWYSALATRAAAPTLSLERRGIPAKQEALLISDWQRQCPRPMVQMKPVTQPADGGEGAIPYCWSWLLDFLFLAPPRARCIMRCGR